jgi:acyl carrier protein
MRVTLEDVLRLVGTQLAVEPASGADRLVEDLGAESGDLLNIVILVEESYGIAIDDAEIEGIATVDELYRAIRSKL